MNIHSGNFCKPVNCKIADLSLIKIPHLPLFIIEFRYNLQTDNMLLHIIPEHM